MILAASFAHYESGGVILHGYICLSRRLSIRLSDIVNYYLNWTEPMMDEEKKERRDPVSMVGPYARIRIIIAIICIFIALAVICVRTFRG